MLCLAAANGTGKPAEAEPNKDTDKGGIQALERAWRQLPLPIRIPVVGIGSFLAYGLYKAAPQEFLGKASAACGLVHCRNPDFHACNDGSTCASKQPHSLATQLTVAALWSSAHLLHACMLCSNSLNVLALSPHCQLFP